MLIVSQTSFLKGWQKNKNSTNYEFLTISKMANIFFRYPLQPTLTVTFSDYLRSLDSIM